MNGDRVEKYVDRYKLTIPIDRQVSNVPMVYNCGVTAQEMKEHGPFIRSALPAYDREWLIAWVVGMKQTLLVGKWLLRV